MEQIIKAYLETTMFNLYFDTEKYGHKVTLAFFDAIKAGQFEPYTSQYVLGELENAPEPKRSDMIGLIDNFGINVLPATDESARLASVYIEQHEGIPESKETDALHISIATVNHMDICVSCNFRHINKLKTKRMVERVNNENRYGPLFICRPEEVIDYDDE
ncbi:MAG: hypothetical protein LBM77_05545 [Spirochaetaceae bacterium]|jgi:hypothetical protein|nr:hypothetical protein [Spirochaetaceae bacterium]